MGKSYAQRVEEMQRLHILQALHKSIRREHTSRNLTYILDATIGFSASHEQVKHYLKWLEEQDLIWLEDVKGVMLAHLAERGLELVEGRLEVFGVANPME